MFLWTVRPPHPVHIAPPPACPSVARTQEDDRQATTQADPRPKAA